MIFSTIDIGTNTILMTTVSAAPDGTIEVVSDRHEIARLGKGVDASRTILPETFDRVAGYLEGYARESRELGAERIVAFGTSALRDARNREEFIDAMKERTGVEIELLSGDEEAEFTYRGALFGLSAPAGRGGIAVLDIGGGSTEIAWGEGVRPERSISIDIGAVRVAERFFTKLPPDPGKIDEARSFIREELNRGFDLPEGTVAVGVAGTVTTLGAVDAELERFDAAELNGRPLPLTSVRRAIERLSTLTLEETAAVPQISRGRADIILAGALILEEFLLRHDLREITVGTRGVRYGVMLREAGKFLHGKPGERE